MRPDCSTKEDAQTGTKKCFKMFITNCECCIGAKEVNINKMSI